MIEQKYQVGIACLIIVLFGLGMIAGHALGSIECNYRLRESSIMNCQDCVRLSYPEYMTVELARINWTIEK